MAEQHSRLVYSTDGSESGRVAQKAGAAKRKPASQTSHRTPPVDGFVRLQREKGGRGGKTVTVVMGLPGGVAELQATLKVLKQHCGAGGTVDGNILEIQGDHRERLRTKLEAMGHRVKLAGG